MAILPYFNDYWALNVR